MEAKFYIKKIRKFESSRKKQARKLKEVQILSSTQILICNPGWGAGRPGAFGPLRRDPGVAGPRSARSRPPVSAGG